MPMDVAISDIPWKRAALFCTGHNRLQAWLKVARWLVCLFAKFNLFGWIWRDEMLVRLVLAIVIAGFVGTGGYYAYWFLAPAAQNPPERGAPSGKTESVPVGVMEAAPAPSGGAPKPMPNPASDASLAAQPVVSTESPTLARAQPPAPSLASAGHAKFDVVRVEPDGNVVLAGRIEPMPLDGAPYSLALVDGERDLDRSDSDGRGQFVFSGIVLSPGTHALGVRAQGILLPERISVVVGSQKTKTQPLVAVLEPGAPANVLDRPQAQDESVPAKPQQTTSSKAVPSQPAPDILPAREGQGAQSGRPEPKPDGQKPGGQNAAPGASAAALPLEITIVSVEYADGGDLTVSGSLSALASKVDALAQSGVIDVSADGELLGTASFALKERAPASLKWQVSKAHETPKKPVKISADAYDAGHKLHLARAQVIFSYQPALAAAPSAASQQHAVFQGNTPDAGAQLPSSEIVVSRGDSLWRISRRLFGEGIRYTEIYEANKTQISNPDLIFPNQKFIIQHGTESVPASVPHAPVKQ